MDTYSYEDYIYTVIGFVGISMAAVSVIPNIVRVTRRFKSKDISYTYQITLATGILLLGIYYVYYKSVLAFPAFLSMALNCYMIGLKFYIENVHTPREAMDGGCIEDAEHKSLLGDDERSENERESPKGYGTKSHNTPKTVT